MKSVAITLQANAIQVVPSVPASAQPELIARVHITGVSGVFNQKPVTAQEGEWNYPYPTMTMLCVALSDGSEFSIELQDVNNKPTWSTGLQSGLNQAINDIQAWI